MSFTVAEIKAKIRKLTGKPSTGQISETNLLAEINKFYQYTFPQEAQIKAFEQHVAFNTVDGTGTKEVSAIDSSIINVTGPVYVDGDEITFWTDHQLFFQEYPLSSTEEGKPNDVLLFNGTLYIRPTPDDVYAIKLNSTFDVPTELGANDSPQDPQWGYMIAYGTAIEILSNSGDKLTADEHTPLYKFYRARVREKQTQKEPTGQRAAPRF
jgi:hypothetical protein